MSESAGGCAVCGVVVKGGSGMARVIIEGRGLCLCLDHAAAVAIAMPVTFEDMRAVFVRAAASSEDVQRLSRVGERRSSADRRAEDRRAFPPRPEGRRMGFGRRSADPID